MVRKVPKPWGYEIIWAETEHYIGKVLHVEAGESLSLQYHHEKDETLYVSTGRVRIEFGEGPDSLSELELGPGDAFRVPPGLVHRMRAIETSDVLEVSTAHGDDLVRLEDRYGRVRPDEEVER